MPAMTCPHPQPCALFLPRSWHRGLHLPHAGFCLCPFCLYPFVTQVPPCAEGTRDRWGSPFLLFLEPTKHLRTVFPTYL